MKRFVAWLALALARVGDWFDTRSTPRRPTHADAPVMLSPCMSCRVLTTCWCETLPCGCEPLCDRCEELARRPEVHA